MFGDTGIIIGLQTKIKKFKQIIIKLLSKEKLSNDEKEFLKREKVIEGT